MENPKGFFIDGWFLLCEGRLAGNCGFRVDEKGFHVVEPLLGQGGEVILGVVDAHPDSVDEMQHGRLRVHGLVVEDVMEFVRGWAYGDQSNVVFHFGFSIVRGQTRGKVCRLQRSTDGTCCAGARTL